MQKPNFEKIFTNLDSRNTTKQLVYFKHNVIQKHFMTNIISKLKKKSYNMYIEVHVCKKKNVAFEKQSEKVYIYDTVI